MGETVIVSKGREDIGKVPALGNDGKLDPSVLPGMDERRVACKAYTANVTTLPQSAETFVSFASVEYDKGGFCTSADKFEIKEGGLYLIQAQMYLNKNATASTLYIKKNQNDILASVVPATECNLAALGVLNQGDYVQIGVQCGDSGLETRQTVPKVPYVSIVKLSD